MIEDWFTGERKREREEDEEKATVVLLLHPTPLSPRRVSVRHIFPLPPRRLIENQPHVVTVLSIESEAHYP